MKQAVASSSAMMVAAVLLLLASVTLGLQKGLSYFVPLFAASGACFIYTRLVNSR